MPRFDANLSFLFTEHPWEARFDAAAEAGFKGIEVNLPWPYHTTPAEFAQRLSDAGLDCVVFLTHGGDVRGEELGLAAVPGAQTRFLDTIRRAIEYAEAAKVGMIHPTAGQLPAGTDPEAAEAVYVQNIAAAADIAGRSGVTLGLEPLWRGQFPGYFLGTTGQALDIIARIGRSNVKIIFDFFHVEMEEGGASTALQRSLPEVAHVQIGNTPHRHEPGRGDIDFAAMFDLLDAAGYSGWIGCEYIPSTSDTLGSLDWAKPWGLGRHANRKLPARV